VSRAFRHLEQVWHSGRPQSRGDTISRCSLSTLAMQGSEATEALPYPLRGTSAEAKTEESAILLLARNCHHIPRVIRPQVPSS
jgi:hypothetical protein